MHHTICDMYLSKLYDPSERRRRIRYAIATILRDRIVNEGAFNVCFEIDEEDVIRAILRRGLTNSKLRVALRSSHLVNLAYWLRRFPEFAEAYYTMDIPASLKTSNSQIDKEN